MSSGALDDRALERLLEGLRSPDGSAPEERYEFLEPLGRGGMGVVWRVRDRELEREVALKLCAAEPGQLARRAALEQLLQREARVLAALDHPGIVPVLDAGRLADGRAYYAMKLVRGVNLRDWLERAPTVRERVGVVLRVAQAVAAAHAAGVLHRDLHPANAMIGDFGAVHVLDWGLALRGAAQCDDAASREPGAAASWAAAQQPRAVCGTPGYMSPEQQRGEQLDAGSDVFALGALLYFVLEGRDPDPGATALVPRNARGPVPRVLAALCALSTAAEPAARSASAAQFAAELERFLAGERLLSVREPWSERLRRLAARHALALALLGAYVVLRVLTALFLRL